MKERVTVCPKCGTDMLLFGVAKENPNDEHFSFDTNYTKVEEYICPNCQKRSAFKTQHQCD